MENSPPCDVCQGLDIYHLVISADSLLKRAANGCDACAILKEGIGYFVQSFEAIASFELLVDYSLYVAIINKDTKKLATIEFYTHVDHPVVWRKIGPGRDVSENSSSGECIALAKRWLEGCLRAHKLCKRLSTPSLPTRVIDVGLSDRDTRLYISRGETAEYAALSHRWGGGNPLITTASTLADRTGSIQFDESSKTFKDACDVTRVLGISYLWIDSLCIIQDSKNDWESQAARMKDVYSNATVTISANGATNPSEGLFPSPQERKSMHRIFEIRCKGPDGQASRIYVRSRYGDPFNTENTVHSSIVRQKSNLITRGWVLQEELLSPRMLHFNKEEMSWVCSTYSRCECRIRPAIPLPSMFRTSPETRAPSSEYTYKLHLEWPLIVMQFTRRNLSHASDRLPALSGLASWMEKQTRNKYFCGLWFEDIAFQLLWYSGCQEDDSHLPTRYKDPYAPSWSWASISGPINYYARIQPDSALQHPAYLGDAVAPLLEVPYLHIIPCGPNKYGPVTLSLMRVLAPVLPVTFDRVRNLWIPNIKIKDLNPTNLKISIDVPSELPQTGDTDSTGSYSFILAGRWKSADRVSILPLQAVCLLVRRMTISEDPVDLLMTLPDFREEVGIGDSCVRVGLVRHAGSIEAWKAAVPKSSLVNLF